MTRRLFPTPIWIVLALLFSTPHLQAGEGQWYLGLGAGSSTLEPETEGSPFRLDDTGGSAYQLYLGYDWKQKISIEGFFADLGEATFTNDADLGYQIYGAGLHYYLPDNDDGPSLYLRGGIGHFNISGSVPYEVANSTPAFVGVGVEIRFENGFGLRAGFDYYDKDAQMFGLSISKRFGQRKDSIPDWARDIRGSGPDFDIEESGFTTLDPEDMLPEAVGGGELEQAVIPQIDNPAELTSVLGVIDGVRFISGTDSLRAESEPVLDDVAATLLAYEDAEFVLIGHTDDVGDPESNRALSLERAKRVGEYLIQQGIDADRIFYIGAGEDEPRSRNDSPEGRAMNRRIELLLR